MGSRPLQVTWLESAFHYRLACVWSLTVELRRKNSSSRDAASLCATGKKWAARVLAAGIAVNRAARVESAGERRTSRLLAAMEKRHHEPAAIVSQRQTKLPRTRRNSQRLCFAFIFFFVRWLYLRTRADRCILFSGERFGDVIDCAA